MTAVPATALEQVLEAVREAVAVVLEVSPVGLERDTDLALLGADSLALVEIVEVAEQALRQRHPALRLPDEGLDELRTVGDVVDVALVRL